MCRNGRTDRVAVRSMDSYDPNEHTRTQPFNGLWSGTTRVGRYQKKHSPTHSHPHYQKYFYQLPPFTTIHNILFVQFTCLAWAKQTTVLSGRPDLLRKRGTWGHSWAWPDFIAVDILNLVCDAATCCQWCGNLLVGFCWRARYLRQCDRAGHADSYPSLSYPEMYLLEGGYRAFYERYSRHCSPRAYLPMLKPGCETALRRYRAECKRDSRRLKLSVDSRLTSSSEGSRPRTLRF